MVDRQRGDIVFVTSDVVRLPRTYMAAYVTSKNALEGLARAMQMELEGTGVRVGIVRPGPSATEQGNAWPPEVVDEVLARSEEHTSELQSLMRISYAVFCLKKKKTTMLT